MKKVAVGACVLALLLFAVVRLRPKPVPPLETPTAQQMKTAFPGNSRTIFEQSDKFFLLSLDPSWDSLGKQGKNIFHGFRILGKTEVKDGQVRQNLRRLYYDGIADKNFSAACFNPAHGIRATKGRSVLDLLICFHCSQVKVVFNGKDHGYVHWSSSHRAEFDEVLTQAKVAIQAK